METVGVWFLLLYCLLSCADPFEDSDNDIVMPEGPPPGASSGELQNDSDDDIPMPKGPPPSTIFSSSPTLDLLQNSTEAMN